MEVAYVAANSQPSQFKEPYCAFIKAFGSLHENRNLLMHSRAHNAWPRDVYVSDITLAKQSKRAPDENNFISLNVGELRDVANDLDAFATFGWELYVWRLAFITGGKITFTDSEPWIPTLPKIPAPPRKLTLSAQPTQANDLSQPQS